MGCNSGFRTGPSRTKAGVGEAGKMMRRHILFVLFLAIVMAACARPHYVRKSEPRTRADSLALRADSLQWAEAIRVGSSCITGNQGTRIAPPRH